MQDLLFFLKVTALTYFGGLAGLFLFLMSITGYQHLRRPKQRRLFGSSDLSLQLQSDILEALENAER